MTTEKRSRFVRPETRKLQISNGDWLLVKRRLTSGEQRASYARLYTTSDEDGRVRVNPLQTGINLILAYLIDWSFVDDDGEPVVIRGVPLDEVQAALDLLDPIDFQEVLRAIEEHERAMLDEREQEKKLPDGASASNPISTSPAVADGGTNGSLT